MLPFGTRAISGERQRGTLALLHASAMTASQIVLGKFIVAVGYALLFVFASLPLFSLVLLLGSIEVFELVMALSVVIASIAKAAGAEPPRVLLPFPTGPLLPAN